VTVNQGNGQDLSRGSLGGRGSRRSQVDISPPSGRGRGALEITSPISGRGRPRGTLTPRDTHVSLRGGASHTRENLKGHGRGDFWTTVQEEKRQKLDLEPPAQLMSAISTPVRGGRSTGLEEDTGLNSQLQAFGTPLRSEAKYVDSMPFGVQEPDVDTLQDLGRVFDLHHGGSDTYTYS
jgi:hypothetical protein